MQAGNRTMASAPAQDGIFSVTSLNRTIRALLEGEFPDLWVEGEISNLRRQASGHVYFTLKDEGAQISCVQFRGRGGATRTTRLEDGMLVQVNGRLGVYEPRGQYQIVVSVVQPKGEGLLQAKFEALKRKLDAEGLFDSAAKRALPDFPAKIGIVTSPTGAAIRDMLHVLQRRSPWIEVLIASARVQGAGAAEEVVAGITLLNETDVDLIVVARGGGSIEDLWAFNEEIVARAISASQLPVVSAVGHEIDFTIADFAADLRAPTPSAAAELISQDREDLLRRIERLRQSMRQELISSVRMNREKMQRFRQSSLQQIIMRRIEREQQLVDQYAEVIARETESRLEKYRAQLTMTSRLLRLHHPAALLKTRGESLSRLQSLLRNAARNQLEDARKRHERLHAVFRVLGPQATLERGFSITSLANGSVLRDASQLKTGTRLTTRLASGSAESEVLEVSAS